MLWQHELTYSICSFSSRASLLAVNLHLISAAASTASIGSLTIKRYSLLIERTVLWSRVYRSSKFATMSSSTGRGERGRGGGGVGE